MAKDTYLQVRITEIEKKYIMQKAKKEGLSLTEYVMRKIIPEKYEVLQQWERQVETILQASSS